MNREHEALTSLFEELRPCCGSQDCREKDVRRFVLKADSVERDSYPVALTAEANALLAEILPRPETWPARKYGREAATAT